MKKSQQVLLKLAAKFQVKYAQSAVQEEIQQNVAAAASWGPQVHGIMNFPEQLKRDQATMNIPVSKRGHEITVGTPSLNPASVYFNYASLPEQIKNYLEKYIELFPTDVGSIDMVLNYSGITD